MRHPPIAILDNNCLDRLEDLSKQQRLFVNLRATGREVWPTSQNVLEALKARSPDDRKRLLTTIGQLAGDNHALTLPGDLLRRIAHTVLHGGSIVITEPKVTRFIRDPESVTEDEAALARQHLVDDEAQFTAVHEEARVRMRPVFKSAGARDLWQSPGDFIDQFWSGADSLRPYLEGIWDAWGFSPPVPVEELLKHDAYRLYFAGWGASIYSRHIAHPQRPKVQISDLAQLAYLGCHSNRLLITDDNEFRALSNAIVRGRYGCAKVVSLNEMLDA